MSLFISSFLISLLVTLVVVRSADRHVALSADHDLSGPQKFHARPVPRIGGIGVLAGVLGGAALLALMRGQEARPLSTLVAVGLPAFAAGLAEDLTKSISPRRRLIATVLSAALAAFFLGAVLHRTDIPGVDYLIGLPIFAVALTLLCVTGVANAINIIDGFNGLASMCVTIILLAIAYVAFQVGDRFVLMSALISAGAVLGFFIWNFPAGLIFLGDGGAYFLGFMVAELSVLLLLRNPDVSPIFTLLLCAYPIFETIFTMYRRKVVRGVATAEPDGIHLHTLVHRRLIRWVGHGTDERRQTVRNSMTSPYLWLLCLLSVVPAVLWWNSTMVLSFFVFLFMASYVALYASIVRFKAPRWLVIRR